jgi:hypothetical protein
MRLMCKREDSTESDMNTLPLTGQLRFLPSQHVVGVDGLNAREGTAVCKLRQSLGWAMAKRRAALERDSASNKKCARRLATSRIGDLSRLDRQSDVPSTGARVA